MAVGVDDDMGPEIKSFPWLEKSCLLLCSDGLTDMVDDGEILSVVDNASSLKAACRGLVARANEKGGDDNITVLLVRDSGVTRPDSGLHGPQSCERLLR